MYYVAMVPRSLRLWFVVHFYADVFAAVPLFLAPRTVQGWLGWTAVDPLATRLVAAALFGIGIESYLARNASLETFRGMLNLKVIWLLRAAVPIATVSVYNVRVVALLRQPDLAVATDVRSLLQLVGEGDTLPVGVGRAPNS